MLNRDNSNKLVCFFDSGIGGLNLMYGCYKLRPDCDYAYFADNYNVPYGSRSKEEVTALVDKIFEKIALLKPAAAVVACNTVTAECINFLRKKYPFPIVGIQPAIKPALAKSKHCLILATPATLQSQSVKELIAKYGADRAEIAPCNDLAAYIENNIFNLDMGAVEKLLPETECDGVILGCTHYIYISKAVKARYGCPLYDGVEGTVKQICKILGKSDHQPFSPREVTFYGGNCTKNAKIFEFLKSDFIF